MFKRTIKIIVWAIAGLYLAIVTLLHIPFIQNAIGECVSGVLSEKLGTKVSVGRVDLGFINRIIIDDSQMLDQQNKLRRSGIAPFFDVVSIVSDKTEDAYHNLCTELQVSPAELLMVGNSFRSDIAPALQIGAYAVHVPFHTIWAHEKTEEYEHERLWRVDNLKEMLGS